MKMVRNTGIEPVGNTLLAPPDCDTYCDTDHVLSEIVAAWPKLSPPLQAAILAIVRSVELKVVPPRQGFTGAANEAPVPTSPQGNQNLLGAVRADSSNLTASKKARANTKKPKTKRKSI